MKTKVDKETYEHFVEEYAIVSKAVFDAEDELQGELQELIKERKVNQEEYCLRIAKKIVDDNYEIKE